MDRLAVVLDGLERVPEGFEVHPRLAKQLARRREQLEGDAVDWSLAEALALGSIVLEGHELMSLSAAQIARLGIGYVPQGRAMFAGMSVRDNLELGSLRRRTGHGVHWDEDKIFAFFPRLRERLDTPADYLSGGEQQMAAVARALVGDVRVLLLDEPFEGLAPAVIEELFDAFDKLRQDVTIIIVEHNLDLVLALADRAYVLERGTVVHEGPARPLLQDLDLRRQVLWL